MNFWKNSVNKPSERFIVWSTSWGICLESRIAAANALPQKTNFSKKSVSRPSRQFKAWISYRWLSSKSGRATANACHQKKTALHIKTTTDFSIPTKVLLINHLLFAFFFFCFLFIYNWNYASCRHYFLFPPNSFFQQKKVFYRERANLYFPGRKLFLYSINIEF